ncbi:MAG: hypothetical protein KDB27_23285, partial [Planctomycetales bacterium]|nr:hypothetical protein [Planctomycetales bacterium]
MTNLPSDKLLSHSASLREQIAFSARRNSQLPIEAFALANESLRRVLGVELYDVQLIAAKALADGTIAEMQTGEGKTFAALPAAVWRGLFGRGVHISTPNTYLAERDFQQLKPVYEAAGILVGLLPENAPAGEKRAAYACDVTYGSGYEFGFDYLRDQLVLRSRAEMQLGEPLLAPLLGRADRHRTQLETCQRGLAFAIIDEADNVMIDDATSPLILAEADPGPAPDSDAVHLARQIALTLSEEHVVQSGPNQIELTPAGREHVHSPVVPIPVKELQRPWASYVETALRAERFYQRDVHYVIDDDQLHIVDSSTGRIFINRSW